MKVNNMIKIVMLIIMVLFSLTNLFGVAVAGISVILGVVFFFICKAVERQTYEVSGLNIKSIGEDLKDFKIWLWILMPLAMDVIAITLSKIVLPGYIEHMLLRSASMLSFDKVLILIIQLIFFAMGEEIAWRAFFQKQLKSFLPSVPVLLITSILFSLGHLASGDTIIVVYDLLFVFINSLLYGIVFEKTNNAWISSISHFMSNLFSVLILNFFII